MDRVRDAGDVEPVDEVSRAPAEGSPYAPSWEWRTFGALCAFYALTVGTLQVSGLPGWRIAGLGACWAAQAAVTLRFLLRAGRSRAPDPEPRAALALGVAHLVTDGTAVALTGGPGGPLFVTLALPALTSLALFAAARHVRILVAFTFGVLVLLSAVPPSPAGIPDVAGELLAAASALVTLHVAGTSVIRLRAALRASSRELAAAREEVTSRALSRARALEEAGSQVAHEIKNPLAAAKALAQLGAGGAESAASRQVFQAIEGEIVRMQDVLRAYLSFARPAETLRDAPPQEAPTTLRWPRRLVALMASFNTLAVAAAWAAGLAPWRVSALAAVGLVMVVVTLRFAPRVDAREMLEAYPPAAFRLQLLLLSCATSWSALTGGVRSPFLVLILGPAIGSLAIYGGTWQARTVVLATAGAVLLLGLAPEAVTGAPPPGAVGVALAAATAFVLILLVGANVVRVRRALQVTARELSGAREELASHAFARARGLEEAGAKVARELEAPLAAVAALARAGAEPPGGGHEREWLAVIGREAARMSGILADYGSFARPLEGFRPQPVELGPLVAEVLAVLSGRAARAGVREERRGDAFVQGDPRRLKEALLNLVSNAIDATPAGGMVEVDVGSESGAARIVIRDSGRGMAPDVLARVGTPFFTTRDAGTGLGVALARSVFRRHGGGLRYESAPGQGTTVTATLPI